MTRRDETGNVVLGEERMAHVSDVAAERARSFIKLSLSPSESQQDCKTPTSQQVADSAELN